MKERLFAGLLVIALGLGGCVNDTEEVTTGTIASTAATTSHVSEITETATTTVTTTTAIIEQTPEKTFPVIDGSTSTIALDTYFRKKILDITAQDAHWDIREVRHSKTFEAFENLVNDKADIVLSVPLAKEQEEYAAEHNFEFEAVPVAMEGFVFLVNPKNPVQSLTEEQLRDIYSGKITNWKELGGIDAPIEAYQRNRNSGSQTYMTEFMGETELTEAPTTLVHGEMGAVVEMFENYDNSINAIGYSVYSYAATYAENAGILSLVAIDGVKPSRTTFIDRTYPLLSETYAFYEKDTTDSLVLDYIVLITSEKGQRYVLEAGYIPVMDIEIPPAYTIYEARGTGAEMPKTRNLDSYSLNFDFNTRPQGFLKDAEFEAEIQAWIDDALEYAKKQTVHSYEDEDDISIYANIENGYMGISVGYHTYAENYGTDQLYGKAAVFDLRKKKRVESLSDLFFKDIDFVPDINNYISSEITSLADIAYSHEIMKCEYFGLCEGFSFDLESIYMPEINAYFPDNAEFFVGLTYTDKSVVSECYNFSDLITHEYAEKTEFREYSAESPDENFYYKNGNLYTFYDYRDVENDRELPINKNIEEAFDVYYGDKVNLSNGTERCHINGYFIRISVNYEGPSPYYSTLEHKFMSIDDFFKTGFEDHLEIVQEQENNIGATTKTASEIYDEVYSHWYNNYNVVSNIIDQLYSETNSDMIEISVFNEIKLCINKNWLKDYYQNLPDYLA
jgi:phosphate transport system substrate-binding protein